jgi:hypothetical protein
MSLSMPEGHNTGSRGIALLLTSALDECERSASHPGHFTPVEKTVVRTE